MHVARISMYIAEDLSRPFSPAHVYTVQEENIEHLRLQLHKDVDNLINAYKSDTFGTNEPMVEIVEEGFSGTNGET